MKITEMAGIVKFAIKNDSKGVLSDFCLGQHMTSNYNFLKEVYAILEQATLNQSAVDELCSKYDLALN